MTCYFCYILCTYFIRIIFLKNVDLTKIHILDFAKIDEIQIWYDHKKIINYAKQRLDWKLEYTNIVKNILATSYSFSDAKGYETILGRKLDKRNFKKKNFIIKHIKRNLKSR